MICLYQKLLVLGQFCTYEANFRQTYELKYEEHSGIVSFVMRARD